MDPETADRFVLLLKLGRAAEAERAAREHIAAEPESFQGYYYLAQALLALSRYTEALEVSERVLALAPNLWFAHTQRSALLEDMGRLTESVEAAQSALRFDHAEPAVHLRLAAALWAAGRGEEGDAVTSDARRLFPEDPDILYNSGLVALRRGNMDAVAEAAERGLALDPTNPGFHMLAGVAAGHQAENKLPEGRVRQHRFREAEQLLADAVRLHPPNTFFRLARKINARGSRTDFIVKVMTGWLFGMILCVIVLPIVLRGVTVPCWCWIVLPVVIWLLGLLTHARCPEFSLVMPLGWFDVVTIPLLPEERRKGFLLWVVFLTATAATLFLPMLFVPVEGSAQPAPAPIPHAR